MSQNVTIQTNKLHFNPNLEQDYDVEELGAPGKPVIPSLWGVPLKYIS
jgi:hypothetical protein